MVVMKNIVVLKRFLIAGGNSTLLVWNISKFERDKMVKRYLKKVEQIGFVRDRKLIMMGNELSINATIALASQLGTKGTLQTSGLDSDVEFQNKNGLTAINFSLPFVIRGNVVLLSGIGYLCAKNNIKITKKRLVSLARKYKLPAFGIVIYKNGGIEPYVYVQKTNSLCKETACGSGSIAASLITKKNEIQQPTGEKIFVRVRGTNIEVRAKVNEIYK